MTAGPATRKSIVLTQIIEATTAKQRLLDEYPGSVDRSISRGWTEKLKEIELRLQTLWALRREEKAASSGERAKDRVLKAARIR